MTKKCLVFVAVMSLIQPLNAQLEFVIRKGQIFQGKTEKSEPVKPTISIAAENASAVTKTDFEVESPGAEAIYLLNEGNTVIRYDNNSGVMIATTKKLYRIKILTTGGSDLGDFKIPLYVAGGSASKEERIRNIKAATYNLNEETGQIEVSLLDRELINRTELRENMEEVSFALPNVRVNSIIQVSYEVESPFLTRIDDWYFQKKYPVKQSAYSFRVIAPFRYAFALQGQEQLVNGKTNDDRGMAPLGRLRPYYWEWWSAEDIPAYREEPFTSTREDHIAKLSFQIESSGSGKQEKTYLRSWEDVTRDLRESKRFINPAVIIRYICIRQHT